VEVRLWHIPELTARQACLPVTTAKRTPNKVVAAKTLCEFTASRARVAS